jgi:hypothetical protein
MTWKLTSGKFFGWKNSWVVQFFSVAGYIIHWIGGYLIILLQLTGYGLCQGGKA